MGLLITSIYLMFIGLIATGSFLVSQTYAAKKNDARMGSTWWSGASPGVTMVQYQNQTQISAAAYAEAYASACYSYMAPNLVGWAMENDNPPTIPAGIVVQNGSACQAAPSSSGGGYDIVSMTPAYAGEYGQIQKDTGGSYNWWKPAGCSGGACQIVNVADGTAHNAVILYSPSAVIHWAHVN